MSVTSVSYFTGAGQPAFTTATSVGLPQYITPPEGVTEFLGVQQRMWQVATAYVAPTLSTVATYLSTTCYLTGDSSFNEIGGGVMEWIREYRRIPSTWTNYIGSMAFVYPSRTVATASTTKTITAISSLTLTSVTYTSAAHGFSNGDTLLVTIKSTGGSTIIHGSQWITITGVTTDTFYGRKPFTYNTFVSGSAFKGTPGGPSKTMVAPAYVVSDYYLPGVTSGITTVDDIPLELPFQPVDVYGNETQDLTAATIPTNSEYIDLIKTGSYILADCVVRRYAGNIYVRERTFVQAL